MGTRVTQSKTSHPTQRSAFPTGHWEHIATYLKEGLIIIDSNQKITFFNAAAESLTGVAQTQVYGATYSLVFQNNSWVTSLVTREQDSGNSRTAEEGDLRDRNQRVIPVRVTCSPIFDKDNCSLGFVLVVHDLSYQKELEEEKLRDERLAALGILAAGLAHEIKNPLAGMRGAAQLLQGSRNDPATVSEYANIMIREIDRLGQLLERLLNLSGNSQLDTGLGNIHKTISEVLLLESAALNNKIVVQTHFDPSLPPIVGDDTRLSQVFRNLIINSSQALSEKEEGTLRIATKMVTDFHLLRGSGRVVPRIEPGIGISAPSTDELAPDMESKKEGLPSGRFLCISFDDNGPGIAGAHLPQLFTPFFTTKSDGTGLGLAISQQIIAQHGGTIRVNSRDGHGASFQVYLPVPSV